MDTLYNGYNKTNDRIDALEREMNSRFDYVDEELRLIRAENQEKNEEVNDIKVDLSYIKRDLKKETFKDIRYILKLALLLFIVAGVITIIVLLTNKDAN